MEVSGGGGDGAERRLSSASSLLTEESQPQAQAGMYGTGNGTSQIAPAQAGLKHSQSTSQSDALTDLMSALGASGSALGSSGDISQISRTETPMVSRIPKYHDHTDTNGANGTGGGASGPGTAQHEGVGLAAGMSFTINFVMGSGFLAIPWGMEQAGVGTGIVLLLFATSALYFTCTMLLDAIARTDAIERRQLLVAGVLRAMDSVETSVTGNGTGASAAIMNGGDTKGASDTAAGHEAVVGSFLDEGSNFTSPSESALAVVSPDVVRAARGVPTHVLDFALRPPKGPITLTWRKYELPELVGMYFGSAVQLVYTCLACLYIYGALWSYASLFGLAVTAHIKLPGIKDPEWSYRIFTASFGALVVVISMFDVKEQVSFQMAMTGMRILIVSVMVLTVAMSMAGDDAEADFGEDGVPWAERTGTAAPISGLNGTDPGTGPTEFSADYFFFGTTGFTFRGIARLLPIVVYSQLFHTGLPTLAEPLADKKNAHNVFKYAYVTTASFYCLASSILALYFGSAIEDSANVNWARYRGPGIRAAMGYLVVFFPAFDVSSVFPINAVALSSNLMSAVFGERSTKVERDDRSTVIVFRLLASVPPVIGACLSHNLAQILDYSGVVGLLIATVIPPLLWEATLRRSSRVFGKEGTEEQASGAWCAPCLSERVRVRLAQAICGTWGYEPGSDGSGFHSMDQSVGGGRDSSSGLEAACNCFRMACDEGPEGARGVFGGPLVVGEETIVYADGGTATRGAGVGVGGPQPHYQDGVAASSPSGASPAGVAFSGSLPVAPHGNAPLRKRRNGCVRWVCGAVAEQQLGFVELEPASDRTSDGESCCVSALWSMGLGLSAKPAGAKSVKLGMGHRRVSSQGDSSALLGSKGGNRSSSDSVLGVAAAASRRTGDDNDSGDLNDESDTDAGDSMSVARHASGVVDSNSVGGVELEVEEGRSGVLPGSRSREQEQPLEWVKLAKPLQGSLGAEPGANPLEAAVPRALTEASRVLSTEQLPQTPYGGWWSSIVCARLLLLVGVILCLFSSLALGGLFGSETDSDGPPASHDDDAESGPGTGGRLLQTWNPYARGRLAQPWLQEAAANKPT